MRIISNQQSVPNKTARNTASYIELITIHTMSSLEGALRKSAIKKVPKMTRG